MTKSCAPRCAHDAPTNCFQSISREQCVHTLALRQHNRWLCVVCLYVRSSPLQVNMHCPYSKIRSLELEPGDYIVQVEGYSRYEGKFNLNLLCESDCA